MGAKTSRSYKGGLLMVGLDGAGKTTILYRLKGKPHWQVIRDESSMRYNLGYTWSMDAYHSKEFVFSIYDFKGQQQTRDLWKRVKYHDPLLGVIFVVDSSNVLERIAETREFLGDILRASNPSKIPVLVLANKQDLPGALTPQEISEKLRISDHKVTIHDDLSFQHSHTVLGPHHVYGACATSGDGLGEAMKKMCKLVKKREKMVKKLVRAQQQFLQN